jgi:hypothetical protein
MRNSPGGPAGGGILYLSRAGGAPAAERPHVMVPWRTIFFAVNFALSISMVGICVGALAEVFGGGGSPGSLMGGMCFIWPAAVCAIAEWALYFRNVRWLERPLGIFAGLVGALTFFALVTNAGEAIVKGDSPGIGAWFGFGSICLALAAYGLWCAWLRIRRRTLPEQRGFPVVQSRSR